MKTLVQEECCRQCETFIKEINKQNRGPKVTSVTIETSERDQLLHIERKKNSVRDILQTARNLHDSYDKNYGEEIVSDQRLEPTQKLQNLMMKAECSTLNLVTLSMTDTLTSLNSQIRGCRAIWTLCFVDYNSKGTKSTSSAVSAILEAMKFHAGSPELAEIAFEALLELSNKCVQNANIIIDKGGANAIANAIKIHSEFEILRQKGVATLCSLIFYYDEAHMTINAVENVILELVKTMKHYPLNSNLQLKVCWAILNLSGSHYNNQEISSAISSSGIIPIVLQTMQNHESNTKLLEYACGSISNLAINNCKNRLDLLGRKGPATVIRMARKHTKVKDIVIIAFQALLSMISTDDACVVQNRLFTEVNKELIDSMINEGLMSLIKDVMKHYFDEEKIQEIACQLLRSLTFNLKVMIRMEKEIPMELLEEAKTKFPDACLEHVNRLIRRTKFVRLD